MAYDFLLKGGHLIDPKNNVDAPMDLAITGGEVAAVEPDIPADRSNRVVDVSGLYVTPEIPSLPDGRARGSST